MPSNGAAYEPTRASAAPFSKLTASDDGVFCGSV
jgi:hypothetical protein